ncbi:hypothetical protein QTN25_007807 [Entamoeba marina]
MPVTGYDGIDYGCLKYTYSEADDMYIDFESYEPVDGVCENPYTVVESSSEVNSDSSTTTSSSVDSDSNNEDKGTGIVIIAGVLLTLLLLL